MRSMISPLACVVLLAWATGCGGPTLTRLNVGTLQVGQTTERDLREAFGKPTIAEERSDGGSVSKLLQYRLHEGGTTIIGYRAVDFRFLVAEVYNGRLRAWLYFSGGGDDATRVRASAVPQVVRGQTRAEVVRLLGDPAGQALRGTLIEDYRQEFGPGVQEIWAWTAVEGASGWPGQRVAARMLLVKFDTAGRVLEVVNRTLKG